MPERRLPIAILLLLVGQLLIFLLAGGTDISTRVFLSSVDLGLTGLGELISTVMLLVLLAVWALLFAWGTHHRQMLSLIRLALGGIGATAAYISSEMLKLTYTRVRPCIAHEVTASCPPAENWSFPSNHTVIAFSVAVAIATAWPRLAWLTVPLAAMAGVSRVFAGHHYPHDVLAGAVLGTTVTLAVVLVAANPLHRLLHTTGAAALRRRTRRRSHDR